MVQKTVFQIHCLKSSYKYLLGMYIHTEMTWEGLRVASVSLQEDIALQNFSSRFRGIFHLLPVLILKVPWFCRLTI